MDKDMTTAGDANWRAACESESRARDAWQSRYGWIRQEYVQMNRELEELRARRPKPEGCHGAYDAKDRRTVLPFPVTTAKEVGWLSGRRDFQLEKYGPYPYTAPSRPPLHPPGCDGVHGC